MPLSFAASVGSVSGGISILSNNYASEASGNGMLSFPCLLYRSYPAKKAAIFTPKAVVSGADTDKADQVEEKSVSSAVDDVKQARRLADWKAARAYKERGLIFDGRVEDFNNGGMLIRFYSLVGFLPYPQLSPSHSNKEPHKPIQEVAEGLTGTIVSVKVILCDEENKKLIFSEKEASWTKYSQLINVGDVFQARVGSIEDYGAFVHLKFPDGNYHITGLVHVSEVSWDLVQDVRDILTQGDEVKVKVINIDREKARITLSMKQLEEDPLLETLEKVIPQDDTFVSDDTNQGYEIEPLPGLETIFQELMQEEGIDGVKISRQGFEKRVVSQDLQLWLSNVPPSGNQFTLLARAGRQVQDGKCRILRWVNQATLKAIKEKKEPEVPEPEPEPTTEVLFLCSYEGCGKTFFDAGSLRKHSHIHGERQYVCHYENCGKKFLDSSKLKRHFLIHTGARDFVCPYEGCGKAFSLDFNLRSHMKTHSQENYHICPYPDCGKRYAHEYKLKNHIASQHEKNSAEAAKYSSPAEKPIKTPKSTPSTYASVASSERPYACPYEGCEKAYIHEYKLNLHLRREHPGHFEKDNNNNNNNNAKNGGGQSTAENEMYDEASDLDGYAGKRGNEKNQKQASRGKPNLKLPPAKVAQTQRKGSTSSPAANMNVMKKQIPPVKEDSYDDDEEDSEETEEERDNVGDGWRYAGEEEEDDDEETEYED